MFIKFVKSKTSQDWWFPLPNDEEGRRLSFLLTTSGAMSGTSTAPTRLGWFAFTLSRTVEVKGHRYEGDSTLRLALVSDLVDCVCEEFPL